MSFNSAEALERQKCFIDVKMWIASATLDSCEGSPADLETNFVPD